MEYSDFKGKCKRLWILCLLSVLSFSSLFAQNVNVKGYVYDKSSGEPLIGATVMQKGTQNGVVTDVDGNFTLNIPVNGVFVVNYIGQ